MPALFAMFLVLSSAAAQQAEFKPPAQMLQQMRSAAAPGPEHKALAGFVGSWDVVTTVWPGPGAPPLTFKGEAVKDWALGGRFLRERLTTQGPEGETVHGLGFVGFDRGLKRYQGVYMATDRTGLVNYDGDFAAATGTFTYTGIESDPVGKSPPMKFKMLVKVDGADHHTLTQFYVVPGLGEVRGFQMTFSRTKIKK